MKPHLINHITQTARKKRKYTYELCQWIQGWARRKWHECRIPPTQRRNPREACTAHEPAATCWSHKRLAAKRSGARRWRWLPSSRKALPLSSSWTSVMKIENKSLSLNLTMTAVLIYDLCTPVHMHTSAVPPHWSPVTNKPWQSNLFVVWNANTNG